MAPLSARVHGIDGPGSWSPKTTVPSARGLARLVIIALAPLVLAVGCVSQAAPNLTISYSDTPVAAGSGRDPTPTAGSSRTITRLPSRPVPTGTVRQSQSALPPAPVVIASAGDPTNISDPGSTSPASAAPPVAPSTSPSSGAQATAPRDPSAPSAISPGPTPSNGSDLSSPVTPGSSSLSAAPMTGAATVDSIAPTATPAVGVSGTVAPSSTSVLSPVGGLTPTPIPGQVSEAVGLFVTSKTSSAKYYYPRSDNGWHRIHPDNRVWFLTADDLLRAFPRRSLHVVPTRSPTRTPTPST